MNRCVINGYTSNFAMCTNGGIYRFPNGFSDPGDDDVRVFYGNVTQGKSSNDFNVIDGSLSAIRWGGYDNQNLNGVPTSGELFKYDVQLSTSTVGSEWVLTDYSSGDNYIIRGEGLNNRVVELTTTDYKLNNEYDGNRQAKGLAFLFSGKVVDADGIINSPNTYLITNIDKFEVR